MQICISNEYSSQFFKAKNRISIFFIENIFPNFIILGTVSKSDVIESTAPNSETFLEKEQRSSRQREALIKEEHSVFAATEDTSRKNNKKRHYNNLTINHQHLNTSVINSNPGQAKCAKTITQSSSQQRQRQLQFLRLVHKKNNKHQEVHFNQNVTEVGPNNRSSGGVHLRKRYIH